MDRALQTWPSMDEHTAAFAGALQAFLRQYGHRSFYLDIYHPTFADEPAQVLDLVQRVRSQPAGHGRNEWPCARKRACVLREALSRGVWGWLKRGHL